MKQGERTVGYLERPRREIAPCIVQRWDKLGISRSQPPRSRQDRRPLMETAVDLHLFGPKIQTSIAEDESDARKKQSRQCFSSQEPIAHTELASLPPKCLLGY